MRRSGIHQQHGQSPRRGHEIRRHFRNIIFQTRVNQQAVWRVLVLLISLLCAHKLLLRQSSQREHSVVFFKLYSTDHLHNNFTQNLEGSAFGTSLLRRKLSEIHDSCPQFRLFGGFSHTLWNQVYYVKMAVGRSRKVFHFQIDTGSAPSWLHCKWPTIQEHPPDGPNGMYMPEKQQQIDCRLPECKMLQNIPVDRVHTLWPCDANNEWQCTYDLTYYDSSNYRGLFVQDVVTFETSEGHQLQAAVSLICSWHVMSSGSSRKDNTKKWPLTGDGLIGLNKGKFSFISQLRSKGVISSNTIGHCFRPLDTLDVQKDSGFMFFGKNKLLYTLEIMWTPMTLPSESVTKYLYEIYIKNIKLGKLSLEMTDKSRIMIIDCGSTRSYVGKSFYQPIKDQVIEQANLKGYDKFQGPMPLDIFDTHDANDLDCWCIPENGNPKNDFETLHIELAELAPNDPKATLNLKPEQYLTWKGCVTNDCKLLCFALATEQDGESPKLAFSIGGSALQGYLVVYDTEEGRVGWMESDCNEDEFLRLHKNTLLSTQMSATKKSATLWF